VEHPLEEELIKASNFRVQNDLKNAPWTDRKLEFVLDLCGSE